MRVDELLLPSRTKPNAEAEARWRKRLAPYYAEFALDPATAPAGPARAPFGESLCAVIEETRAVKDRDYLDKSITRYKAVSTKFKDSAAGQAAAERAKYLEENRPSVGEFYASFQQHVAPFGLGPMELPPDLEKKLREKVKK